MVLDRHGLELLLYVKQVKCIGVGLMSHNNLSVDNCLKIVVKQINSFLNAEKKDSSSITCFIKIIIKLISYLNNWDVSMDGISKLLSVFSSSEQNKLLSPCKNAYSI